MNKYFDMYSDLYMILIRSHETQGKIRETLEIIKSAQTLEQLPDEAKKIMNKLELLENRLADFKRKYAELAQ